MTRRVFGCIEEYNNEMERMTREIGQRVLLICHDAKQWRCVDLVEGLPPRMYVALMNTVREGLEKFMGLQKTPSVKISGSLVGAVSACFYALQKSPLRATAFWNRTFISAFIMNSVCHALKHDTDYSPFFHVDVLTQHQQQRLQS